MPRRLSFREEILLFHKNNSSSPRGSSASKDSIFCDPMWRAENASYPDGRAESVDVDAIYTATYYNFDDLMGGPDDEAMEEGVACEERMSEGSVDDAWIDPELGLDEDGLPAVAVVEPLTGQDAHASSEAVVVMDADTEVEKPSPLEASATLAPSEPAPVPAAAASLSSPSASVTRCVYDTMPADALAAFLKYDAEVRAQDAALRNAIARTERRRREVEAEEAAAAAALRPKALAAVAPVGSRPGSTASPLGQPPATSLAAQLPLDVAAALLKMVASEHQARLEMLPYRITSFGLSATNGPTSTMVSPI
jgi:hypothetical protein